MRCACIDIGSNTTRLLVADCGAGGLVPVHNERAFTLIGASLGPGGQIPVAKQDEVARIVSAQRDRADELGASAIRCVATAAVRRAGNRDELVARVAASGREMAVEVLSAETEARLAFLGAVETFGGTDGADRWQCGSDSAVGVVDVGGGSSELVVGQPPDRITWWSSVPLGSGELTAAVLPSDPPRTSEIESALRRVGSALGRLRPPPVEDVIAVGGSATSLRRLVGPVLDEDGCRRALRTLSADHAAALAPQLGLDPQRVRLLTAGLIILHGVCEVFDRPLVIGQGGLREGVLLELAAGG